jgi:hypothetical protein
MELNIFLGEFISLKDQHPLLKVAQLAKKSPNLATLALPCTEINKS